MASKLFTGDRGGLEKGLIDLFAVVTGAGTGAPVLQQFNPNITNGSPSTYTAAGSNGFRGILSVTRNSALGLWTVVFGGGGAFDPTDAYVRLLGVEIAGYENASGIPTATAVGIVNASAVPVLGVTATGVQIQLSAAGSAIDAAAGDTVILHFWLQNSLAS